MSASSPVPPLPSCAVTMPIEGDEARWSATGTGRCPDADDPEGATPFARRGKGSLDLPHKERMAVRFTEHRVRSD
jgi:hypothetical protein